MNESLFVVAQAELNIDGLTTKYIKSRGTCTCLIYSTKPGIVVLVSSILRAAPLN